MAVAENTKDEIEVTAEMKAAGADVISGHWLDITAEVDPMPLSEVVEAVFVEMQKARAGYAPPAP